MLDVIIVGEDTATQAIIKRLIQDICPEGLRIVREAPSRGGQIKSLVVNFNQLASSYHVVLLADLDQGQCPATEQINWLRGMPKHPNFMFRFAVDEAESWLLADRHGFARFLGVNPDLIPEATPMNRKEPRNIEIRPPVKSSIFLMYNLVPHSTKQEIKSQLLPRDRFSKGGQWNSALTPFIENHWNISAAKENSYSLYKMYQRLSEWCAEALKK